MVLPGGSPACLANFLRAAAKLEFLVALMALLALWEVMLELGDTWFMGGTVAVVLWIFAAGDTIFSGGAFPVVGSPASRKDFPLYTRDFARASFPTQCVETRAEKRKGPKTFQNQYFLQHL